MKRLAALTLLAAAGCVHQPPGSGQLELEGAIEVIHAAGFVCEDDQLLSAVAIAVTESALYPDAVNLWPVEEYGTKPNGEPHAAQGLFQIASYWWPYPDEQVFDPYGAAVAAYEISSQGTDFHFWDTTWVLGIPQRHFDEAFNGWPALRPQVNAWCVEFEGG